MLATLTVAKAKDADGTEVDIDGEFTDMFFRCVDLPAPMTDCVLTFLQES